MAKYCKFCKIEIANIKYHNNICLYKPNKHIMQIQNFNLIPYKKTASLIVDNTNKLTIKTEAEIKTASDILFQISEFQRKITLEKEKITNPAKAIIKWARDTFGPIEKQCEDSELIIKHKMIDFNAKKEAEALKKLQAVADKLEKGKISLEKASTQIDNLKPANSYSGDMGGISFREYKTVIITDETKIPRKWLVPDMVAIRSAVLAGEIIEGCEIKIEKIVAKGKI